MAGYLSQLTAVLFKAWCSRKYHYVATCLDILLPILFVYLLVAFKGQKTPSDVEGKKIYPLVAKSFLLKNSYDNNFDILYAPNTSLVHNLMLNVKEKLNNQRIDSFYGMKNESEMEKWFYKSSLSNETQWRDGYGIVFNQLSNSSLQYSIRSNKFDVWKTNLRFPEFQYPGPMEAGDMYIHNGFLALQIAIDEAFMEFKNITPINWNLQEFPYPEYKRVDSFQLVYQEVLPFLLCYGYVFSFITLIKNVGEEKESGIRERLKMSGVRPWITYFGWIIDTGLVALVSSAIVTVILTSSWVSKTGAFFEKSNVFIIWITVYLFYVLGSLQAIIVATVYSKPKYSTVFGLCLWMFTYSFFAYLLRKTSSSLTLFFISMIPNGFMLTSINAVITFEVLGSGASFKTLFLQFGSEGVVLSLGCAWIASLCGMILHYALISYIDVVFPGPYGIPQPWYFIFPQKCWRTLCRVSPVKNASIIIEDGGDEVDCHMTTDDDKLKDTKFKYEPLLGSLPVGIKIANLSKQYGTVQALKNFSIDIYKNQITALLGHNGAGKTTLLSIITGMLPPTDGDVSTDEYNVFSYLEKFRSDLGYCPQNDLLLPNLTVVEHIIFFGLIKGLSKKEANANAESVIGKCRLSAKGNTRVAELSGGMRRKLCLAVSLVNDPKILILDEPTSGLDPESRRAIWDILLELRKGRTVLITTHFMEEADVLGDRIAIMSHGELKCYGTSLFLKKNYGSGYHVTILLSQGVTDENILDLISIITKEVPEATVINESKESVTVQLPLNSVNCFPSLFDNLEKRNGDLGVTSLAVSCTTIDDVFQKVNEEEGVKCDVDEVDMPIPYNPLHPSSDYTTTLRRPKIFIWQRLCATSVKKFLWIYRNWILALLYFILPILTIILVTYKSTNSTKEESLEPLLLNLKLYENSEVPMKNITSKYTEPFKHQVLDQGSQIVPIPSELSVVDALLEFGRKDEAKFRTSFIVAGDLEENLPTILYSSIGIHSPPIVINLLSNAIMNGALPGHNYSISTYNFPYSFTSDSCSRGANEMAISAAYTIGLIVALTVILCFFIIHVHNERTTLFKELQLLTGLQFPFYWTYNFIVDFIIYVSIIIIVILCMIIFDTSGMFHSWSMLGSFMLVLCLFGISSLWSAYFYSFFFKTYNGSTTFYMFISTSLCLIGVIVYGVLDYTKWKYIFYLNPLNPAASGIYKIFSEAKFNLMCKLCKSPAVTMLCAAKRSEMEDFDYTTEIIYVGLDWLFYLALIFSIEWGLFSLIWHYIKSLFIGTIPDSERPSDPDVFQEKTKVKGITNDQAEENPVLVVNGLAKKYSRSVTAVKDVSFAVPQGQCFGLLGTNGAGKSTTFQMLTAYIRPTNGDASVCGFTLNKDRSKYKLQIGYCPQSGGLLGDLTGRETLRLFANLRGIPSSEVDDIVEKWLRLLGLTEYENRPTSTYSGGNLRKLSTAIALIGNPPLVFLDEPTTGVDPVTRRKIWKVLKKVQENNQTIVITSHSMDECEALCDRLTILVQGTMQCIGNIQYLKKTYGKGFTILIKLGVISFEDLKELKERVESLFSHKCTLKDEHKGLLHYHLDDPKCLWSTLFKNMAELKTEFTAVEDYVLTDSSLEQVFLAFASENESSSITKC